MAHDSREIRTSTPSRDGYREFHPVTDEVPNRWGVQTLEIADELAADGNYEVLTDGQRQYILRLGATSGREIVPIDMKLYRELLNLEMIVDKGRRLALSKLGHEVFRYLG